MPDENTNTTSENTQTNTETETSTIEPSVSYEPEKSDKDKEIDAIINQYEKAEEQKKKSSEEAAAQKFEEWQKNGMLEGESFKQVYEQSDPATQRVLSEFRKQWTQKNQSLAEERKELETLKASLLQQQQSLTNSDAFKAMQTLAESASLEGFEFDPFNKDSVTELIQGIRAQVAKEFVATLEPMQAEQQAAQARMQTQTYIKQNPELDVGGHLREATFKVLQKYESMSLEDAHRIAKLEYENSQYKSNKDLLLQEQEAERLIGRTMVGNSNAPASPKPSDRKMSAFEIYQRNLKASQS